MGLYEHLYTITKSIKERSNLLNLTHKEVTELLNLYVEKTIVSPFENSRDAIHFVEGFPKNTARKARRLPRFSSSEQRRRGAQSKAVRDMLIEHCIVSTTRLDQYRGANADYDRDVQRLFQSPIPGAPITEAEQAGFKAWNDEIAFLFNNKQNWDSYADMQARILALDSPKAEAFRKQYDIKADQPLTKDVIFNAYARRRAVLTMKRYRECVALINQGAQNYDPSLSPEELASNFWKLKEASFFLSELKTTMSAANKENMPKAFTEAELSEIGDATRYENQCGAAICRFSLIANPQYSVLDPDVMEDYNFSANGGIPEQYTSISEGEMIPDENSNIPVPHYDSRHLEQEVMDEFIARHSDKYTIEDLHTFFDKPTEDKQGNYKTYSLAGGRMSSDFELYTSDFSFYYQNKMMPVADMADEYLKNFGLSARTLSRYAGQPDSVRIYGEEATPQDMNLSTDTIEQPATDLLSAGSPVAFELSGRTIVLSMKTNDRISPDNLTYENPEALYNFDLKNQQQLFTKQLGDSDSMFIRSSQQFKDMKTSLEAVSGLGELSSGQDTAEAEARFRKLLEDTEKYLTYKKDADMMNAAGKGDEATDDADRSDYEQERLNTARRIRKFAQAKLKELELTKAARVTLNDFTRMQNGHRIFVDEQTRNHLINRTDTAARLNAQIREAQAQADAAAAAQAQADAEARAAAEARRQEEEDLNRRWEAFEHAGAAQAQAPNAPQAQAPAQEEVPAQEEAPAQEKQPAAADKNDAEKDDDDIDLDGDVNFDPFALDGDKLDAELNDMFAGMPELNEENSDLTFGGKDDFKKEQYGYDEDEMERQYGHQDPAVSSFSHMRIINQIESHMVSREPFSEDECRSILSASLLYHALRRESEDHTAEATGSMTDMLKNHPNIFTALHQNLAQSNTVNTFLQTLPEGKPITMLEMNAFLDQMKNTPIDSVDLSSHVLTADQCSNLMTNEIMKNLLREERSANQNGKPGALETMMARDRENAEMVANFIKNSAFMKKMISDATVDGQVSFQAVSGLLKKVNDADFINKEPVLDSLSVGGKICGLMFDKAAAKIDDKPNPFHSPEEMTTIKSGRYRDQITYRLQESDLYQTMKDHAGIGRERTISLNNFTKLLNQIPPAEDILNAPTLFTGDCTELLAKDALNRMFEREREIQKAEHPDVIDASTRPLFRLKSCLPNANEKLLQNMVASASEDSLSSKVKEQRPDKSVNKISLAGMETLVKSLDNLDYVNCDVYAENILDQKMTSLLLSDYMLDNMIEMHRLTHGGEAGCLENLKENEPVNYNKLRFELSKSPEVRGILPAENGQPAEKISLSKLEKLFPKVKSPNFCKNAVDKVITAMKANEPQKENVKALDNAPKPMMPRP